MTTPSGTTTARTDTPAPATIAPKPAPPPAGPRHRRTWLVGVLALALLAAGIGAWWLSSSDTSVQYTEAAVSRGDITRTVTATGTVNPVLTIIVGSYVSGVIKEIHCDFNTRVTEGQICAKIDPSPYQTVVDQNKANLAMARAQLLKAKANLAYAQLNFERNERLAQTAAVAKDTLDLSRNVLDQAKAQIAVDEATIEQRQAQLEKAEVDLGYTNIVSPVDGTVVSRNVTVGQTVAASFQTPTLFLIATDLTKMQVDTNVSESDIGGIREGNKATFTVDAFPRRTFEGAVRQVRQSPQTVQNVVTYDVVVGVDNSRLSLKPGMTAATRIVIDERRDVLRVPSQALRFAPAGKAQRRARGAVRGQVEGQVWVLRDGTPVAVPVTTGLDDDSFIEIVKGDLKAGDKIIVSERRDAAKSVPTPRF